ncbi:MAG: hypothetical protein H7X95_05555 [Deltaproteobacteria bacterium]|nr:hypothetical protein [Deltaproteobacteria bacterium]
MARFTRAGGIACFLFSVLITNAGAISAKEPIATPPAIPARPDTPKPETPKADAHKAEAPKAELAKASPKEEAIKAGTAAAPKAQGSPPDDPAAPRTKPSGSNLKPQPKSKAKAQGQAKGSAGGQDLEAMGESASPASPPPLTIAGLRGEANREGGSTSIDPGAPARTKLELMLGEIAKARTSLRDDTARLEAMLTQDGDAPAGLPAAGGAAVPGAAKPPKNPLDVLAKALRGIKPEQAAPIVSRLDKKLAATVLQRMPPVDAGKIMGAMKPDTAAELATQIAMRPLPGEVKR